MRQYQLKFSEHLRDMASECSGESSEAQYLWRMSCYDQGQELVERLKDVGFHIEGLKILDCAGGWGGHATAFLDAGASAYLSDYNDHRFSTLKSKIDSPHFEICRADCMHLPFADASFDVILALELIEHIQDQHAFASEIKRILKPGGICIISTPSRIRSIYDGEPHYNLKLIALLPLWLQKVAAEKVFCKNYPFAITEQFTFSSTALKPYKELGLSTEIWLSKNKKNLMPALRCLFEEILWNYIVVRKEG